MNNKNQISSSDADALLQLQEKLACLQKKQELMKKVNAAHAKYLKNPASLEASDLSEDQKKTIINYVPKYSWEKHPFAPYMISNNNGNISSVRKRIESLSQIKAAKTEEKQVGSITIVENVEDHRIQMFFPGKPSEEVRAKLKGNGFRWSPSIGSWQAFFSHRAKDVAMQIAEEAQ